MKKQGLLRIIALTAAVIMTAGCFAGCSTSGEAVTPATTNQTQTASSPQGTPAKSADKPYVGTTLTWLTWSSQWGKSIYSHLDEFREKTGIKVDYEQLSNDDLASKTAVVMAAGGRDADVFNFRTFMHTGMYVGNGWCEPLNKYFENDTNFDYNDYYESVRKLSEVEGKCYAVPINSEHAILFYNKDMFAKAGLTAAPTTWEQVAEYAKKLNDPAKGVYGISTRGDGSASVVLWIILLRAFGGDYFVNGKAEINSEAAIKATEMYKKLLQYCPPGYLSKNWSDTSDDFAQGIAAMRFDGDAQYTYAVDASSSLIYDKVGYAVLPKGDVKASTTNSCWGMAISSGSQNKDAAWEFIKWCTGKEMDAKVALDGHFSARASTWKDPKVIAKFPEELIDAVVASYAIDDGSPLPVLTSSSEARTIIGNALALAWQGKDYKDALDKANVEFQKLIDKDKK